MSLAAIRTPAALGGRKRNRPAKFTHSDTHQLQMQIRMRKKKSITVRFYELELFLMTNWNCMVDNVVLEWSIF
ncbi:hypothetical protein V2J09_017111 [Rumex salicifolius]